MFIQSYRLDVTHYIYGLKLEIYRSLHLRKCSLEKSNSKFIFLFTCVTRICLFDAGVSQRNTFLYLSRIFEPFIIFPLRGNALSALTYFKGKCKTVLSKIFCCSGRNISMTAVCGPIGRIFLAREESETSRVAGCDATFSRVHQDRCNKPLAPVTDDRLFLGAELRASCHDDGSLIRGEYNDDGEKSALWHLP